MCRYLAETLIVCMFWLLSRSSPEERLRAAACLLWASVITSSRGCLVPCASLLHVAWACTCNDTEDLYSGATPLANPYM